MKKTLSLADGVLGTHLRKLEETGYIACEKSFVGRRPKSTYQLTPTGKAALFQYIEAMQKLFTSVIETETDQDL